MRIAFIGSGNVATVLGRLLKEAGHVIAGVYSTTFANAEALARELETPYFGNLDKIHRNADLYIVAISDDSIFDITKNLRLPGKIIVHTSGATPKNVLKNISNFYGVFYPLQSLRKEATHQPLIPILIDGSDSIVKEQIRIIAESISFMVEEANDEQRLKLHLSAVIVSNFTNYLYSLADEYCTKERIPFKILVPLIQEVANRTAYYSPTVMQTGPAIRGDELTIERHLQLLSAHPALMNTYRQLTESIRHFYKK